MKALGKVRLGVSILVVAGMVTALVGCRRQVALQPAAVAPQFAAEARTFADVASTLAGTWTLKQRLNPDGTPYRSKLEGVTYISLSSKYGNTLGPHAVANVYAKETGVADPAFFSSYPKEIQVQGIAGKEFQMESTGTWLIHNVQTLDTGAQISVRTYTVTKGDLQPYKNGMVLSADVRYNLSRTAPKAGAAAVPRLEVVKVVPGELTDMAGERIAPMALMDACCGMTSLSVTGNTMEIGWSNKGKDVWVKSDRSVPAAFR